MSFERDGHAPILVECRRQDRLNHIGRMSSSRCALRGTCDWDDSSKGSVTSARRKLGVAELLILVGSVTFIFVLWLSAYYEADIRWLHFFQAWMYVAAIALCLSGNRWGYFIGFSAAGLWAYGSVFVNRFFQSGLHWLFAWVSTGQLRHVDQIVAVPAWVGNVMVIVGSVWGYSRLPRKDRVDLGRLALAFVLTTGFFAADIAVCQPRYLPLFRGLLHPHRPW